MKFTRKINGIPYTFEAEGEGLDAAIEQLEDDIVSERDRADKAEAKADAEKKRADEAEAKAKQLNNELEAARDPKVIADAAAELAAVLADSKLIAGEDFAAEGSASEIRRAALEKTDVEVAGKSDAYVDSYFDFQVNAAKAKADSQANADASRAAARDAAVNTNPREDDGQAPLVVTDVFNAVLSGQKEA